MGFGYRLYPSYALEQLCNRVVPKCAATDWGLHGTFAIYFTFGFRGAPVNSTVFWTVVTGVVTFVVGQLIVKLVVDPVQDLKRTIGQISHALIEHANVYQNPGLRPEEVQTEISSHLRKLSSQLQAHLYLVPAYSFTAWVFRLPSRNALLDASKFLIGLSNSISRDSENVMEQNFKRAETIADSLGIYMAEGDRLPRE